MRTLSSTAVHAYHSEMVKIASRGQVTAKVLRKAGLQRVGDHAERLGGKLSDRVTETLMKEIPGTKNVHLPFMDIKSSENLARAIGDDVHTIAALASPVPGTLESVMMANKGVHHAVVKPPRRFQRIPKKGPVRRFFEKHFKKGKEKRSSALSPHQVESFWRELVKISEVDKDRLFKILPAAGAVAGAGVGLAKGKGPVAKRATSAIIGAGTGATTGWLPQIVYEGGKALAPRKGSSTR